MRSVGRMVNVPKYFKDFPDCQDVKHQKWLQHILCYTTYLEHSRNATYSLIKPLLFYLQYYFSFYCFGSVWCSKAWTVCYCVCECMCLLCLLYNKKKKKPKYTRNPLCSTETDRHCLWTCVAQALQHISFPQPKKHTSADVFLLCKKHLAKSPEN